MKRKQKLHLLIGLTLVGLIAIAAAIAFWVVESSRTSRYETQALKAAEAGDWDAAYDYAKKAEAEGAMNATNAVSYRRAESLLDGGDVTGAEALFRSLGAYRDAPERVRECRYREADALYRAGELEAARDAFWALVPYADSQERWAEAGYRIAERLYASGEKQDAFEAFSELIPYGDSEDRAKAIAAELTGETDPDRAMAVLTGETEEQKAAKAALSDARDKLKTGYIAAGKAHIVVLFSDGHVEAVGENGAGQCNVSGFANVTAVAAGFAHTLGLRADGTVAATGNNAYGQCDVSGWTDVAAIACGAWDSYGIRRDGTLLHAGFLDADFSGWTELAFVAASETGAIGVRRDGTLLSTHAKDRFSGNGYAGAALTNGAAFALKTDGTVRCENETVKAWTGVIAIRNSPSVLVGLKADGTLLSCGLLPGCETLLNALAGETDVAEIAVTGTFALIRHGDGTLSLCGDAPEAIREFVRNVPSNAFPADE
ncbi:MAG: hypothetical protein II875_11940 [Clostridia bacterium]|nr:hypothetical protein [Clostridia bacterium]MBR0507444.1 hypothetical protein [Clostridia bacterium]